MPAERWLHLPLAVLAAAGLTTAIRAQLRPPIVPMPAESTDPSGSVNAPATRWNADSVQAIATARNPFRSARAPAAVQFDPAAGLVTGAPPAPQPPRHAPSLSGIMMGAEPAVLLDGIPGVEGGRLLRAGERAGPFLVRAISHDRVVVQGPDTVWTLRLRSTFQ